jgi:serine/threonine-protein kinase
VTIHCPNCGAGNRDNARFCASCRAPLTSPLNLCPNCGTGNVFHARFCSKCGVPLASERACPHCGHTNPPASAFCNRCGAVLHPQYVPQPVPPVYPPPGAGTGTLPPQFVLSRRYVILRRVGKGGMGAVYQAADSRITGKTWAVKEISDVAITDPLEQQQAHAAFRQEALMLASLDHRNLPKVVDHFSEGGKQYLVMDFIDGETLAQRLEREGGGPLPVDEVLGWAEQLCNLLEYLHSQSPPVVFRDLKPGNVMVTPDGTVKLIDFGIARIFKPGKATDTACFGTAGYAPREQYGKGQTDARSDIYALGATLHHLLTGVDPTDEPFRFDDVRQLNSRVPAGMADTVMKAVQDEPADRWRSAAEMSTALTRPPVPKTVPMSRPQPKPQPKLAPTPRPASATANVGAVAIPSPVRAPVASRLTFWRGVWLVLLGIALYGGGSWATNRFVSYVIAPLVFIPSLFGVLFGPWVGGFVGAFEVLALDMLEGWFWSGWWGIALSAFALGAFPGLIVKDARNWKAVCWAGVLAGGVYALGVATTIGIAGGGWGDFWGIVGRLLVAVLPSDVLLLPLFARWLVGWVRKRGLYWRDYR